MKQVNPRLVMELAELFERYGAEDFAALSQALDNEVSRSHLVELLGQFSDLARTSKSKRHGPEGRSTKHSPTRVLSALKETDPEKLRVLTDLHSALVSRQLLPTSSDLRDFASSCGLELKRGLRREAASNQIVRSLARTSLSEVRELLGRITSERDSGKEYSTWVGVILGTPKGDHVFSGPNGQQYALRFIDAFTGVVGFLGITKTVPNYLDVFVRVRIADESVERIYSLQLTHWILSTLLDQGVFPRRPDADYWENLCVRFVSNYVISRDGALVESDVHNLVPLLIRDEDVEVACRSIREA